MDPSADYLYREEDIGTNTSGEISLELTLNQRRSFYIFTVLL